VSSVIGFDPKILLTDGTHEFWEADISVAANEKDGVGPHLLLPYD